MSTQFPDDDPLAARLRDALSSEADMVQTSGNGLQRIRERTNTAHRPWWQHPGVLAVAAAVLLGAAVGVGFAVLGGGDGGNNVVAADPSDTASASVSPSDTPSPTPSDTATTTPAGEPKDVYVYYHAVDPVSGARLYRELIPDAAPASDLPVEVALRAMFRGKPNDPDYHSDWPQGTELVSYASDGDTATVEIKPPDGTDWDDIAFQELVYTVTANANSVQRVILKIDGSPGTPLTLTRAPMLDVQGLIWLLAPTQGATVSSPVQIDGYGTAFEATISWEVRQGGPDGPKVAEGNTMGGSNGEFGEFHDSVDLPPGTYEIRAFESSAEDGRPLHVDTKTFTVR